MQDVHWFAGLLGYFPTYTVGAMTAAQWYESASRAMPDLQENISSGNFQPLISWLRSNIHSKGRSTSTQELLREVTGNELDPSIFRKHLERRYLGVNSS